MNEPLRIGLIGAGMVSRRHLIAWAAIPDLGTLQLVKDCYRPSGWEASR